MDFADEDFAVKDPRGEGLRSGEPRRRLPEPPYPRAVAPLPMSPSSPEARLAELVSIGADALAAIDPVFGEHRLQVAADRFVDRACAALSALAKAAESRRRDDDHGDIGGPGNLDDQGRGIPPRWARW